MNNMNLKTQKHFQGKHLKDIEARLAKTFLYRTYVEDLKWLPHDDNPSQWVVKSGPTGKYLTDIFDVNAEWFAVFEHEDLVGISRIIFPIEKRLEVELYCPIPMRYKKNRCLLAEINRVAIKREYFKSPVLITLTQMMIEFILRKKIDYLFLAAPTSQLLDFCQELGFQLIPPVEGFRYCPEDPETANLMMLNCREIEKLEGILAQCRRLLETLF